MSSQRLALLVGISNYGVGYDPLPGCAEDVRRMQQVLQDEQMGGFTVETLFDPDPQHLREEIERFYARGSSSDVLLFYFSGHGDRDNATCSHLYLTTCHTRKESKRLVEASAVEATFLHRHLVNSRSKQKIVILDCCFSGAIAEVLKKGDESINLAALKAKGAVVLASCSAFEESYQTKGSAIDSSPAQSLYTRYLVEGIKTGAARQGNNEWIVANDLHEYAKQRFQTEFAAAVEPQIIVLEKEGYRIPIARAPKGDPAIAYAQFVAALLQETDGVIDDLDRHELDIKYDSLNLDPETAHQIEAEQLHPYQIRQAKHSQYCQALERATLRGYPFSDRTRYQLNRIQTELSLRDEEVLQLENAVCQWLQLPTTNNPPPIQQNTSRRLAGEKQATSPIPQPTPAPEDDLSSEKGIDYTTLRDLLKAQDWKAADEETYRVMIRAVGKKEGDWFTSEELLNFPCTDLKTIDALWVKYSKGHFGFSVQKQIYVDCGGKLDGKYPSKEIWEKFGDRVGWRKDGKWLDYLDYDDFNPSLSSPPIFPWFGLGGRGLGGGFGVVAGSSLLSHRDL